MTACAAVTRTGQPCSRAGRWRSPFALDRWMCKQHARLHVTEPGGRGRLLHADGRVEAVTRPARRYTRALPTDLDGICQALDRTTAPEQLDRCRLAVATNLPAFITAGSLHPELSAALHRAETRLLRRTA